MIFPKFVPTYEYECPQCPRVFEIRQRISEPSLTTCDRCGGSIHRLLSATPFILKGGGWYVTDYPSEARKKAVSSESGDKSSSSSEAKSGTDSATTPSSSSTGASGSSESSSSAKDSTKSSKSSKESPKPSKESPKSSSAT
jgi:putative FmdB family regulatory protein